MPPAGQSHAIDELFEVRNAFYLGNFQQCIKEAQKLKSNLDHELKLMRDVFMYRAYLGQKKYSIIFDEISSNSAPELCGIRTLAEYLNSEGKRSKIVAEVEEKIKRGQISNLNNTFFLMTAYIYVYEGNIEEALRTLQNGDDLECMAATIQCLLKIDREDLASKQVKKMQEKDDDAILTQLSLAWTYMSVGKEKLQDAFYIYQEMIDKYGSTPLLLNAQASVLIMQEKYEQAEILLNESMEKDNNNPETLVNLTVVAQHLGKPVEHCNRYMNQLKDFVHHPWTRDYLQKESEFNRLCRQYEPTKA